MFSAFYDSAWQHPGLAWGGSIALAALALSRHPSGFLRAYLTAFGLSTALDALCTGALSPIPAALGSSIAIVFVIIGDWRLFVLVERTTNSRRSWFIESIALAFVVPVLQALAIRLWPRAFEEPRHIYLVYELLFLALGLTLRFFVLPGRAVSDRPGANEEKEWALGAVTWFVLQYALWVTADVLILAGSEWALLLRIVPNAMYYAGFLIWVLLRAPRS